MTLVDGAKSLSADIESFVQSVEAQHGAQPKLRHWLHGAQAEAESVLGMPAGTMIPDSGAKPA